MGKKTIYFICNGNSVNDIIHLINKLRPNKQKPILNFYPDKIIKKEDKLNPQTDPVLIKLGIKQLSIFQENNNNRLLLQKFKRIYSSLDTCSIESIFVLYKDISGSIIYPISNMITNKEITNTDSLNKFKNKFGKLTDNKTHVSQYWSKNYNNNIKKINTVINWQFISNLNTKSTYLKNNKSILSNAQFKFKSFEKELIRILNFDPNDSILIVSNYDILIKILQRCTSKIFDNTKNNIEASSMWKIDVEYKDESINYLIFEKMYPTSNNFKPLDYKEEIDKKYRFIYNNIKYTLFNANNIPEEYLKYLYDKSFPDIIKNRLIIKKNNNNILTNSTHKISIENFK